MGASSRVAALVGAMLSQEILNKALRLVYVRRSWTEKSGRCLSAEQMGGNEDQLPEAVFV